MLQKICDNILNEKWNDIENKINFPINAQKIAATECISNSIRQFFNAEINYYCNNISKVLIKNTNISELLLESEDGKNLSNILFDWVEFNEEQTYNILKNAIQTEIFFLLNPAKCLTIFLYKKNENTQNEKKIKSIIKELDFIYDSQNIINKLKNELLELTNIKETLTDNEFSNLATDIVFNITQKMEIKELLQPLKSIQEILSSENIPLTIINIFFYEYDLAGILTKINEYAQNNEKESLVFDEIIEIINGTLENPNETSETINITNINNIPINLEEYAENIENEVDSVITEMELNPADNIISETSENIIEIPENVIETDVEKEIILDEILDEVVKMRTEKLSPMEIETTYLNMERNFLKNIEITF